MDKAMMCDAIATTCGAVCGTSTVTTFVEASAGVAEGGRTGLTEAQAKAAGYDVITALAVTDDKAHYYPDAATFITKLIADTDTAEAMADELEKAKYYQGTILTDMAELRAVADEAEALIPDDMLPYPDYAKILFYV